MKTWRSGQFERERLSGLFRPFAPAHAVESLVSINLEQLWNAGKRLLLLDVDNTLVAWRGENFSEPVLQWIANAKQMGFGICIISNTRRLYRLARIRELLGVEAVRGRFKPSRVMYRLALIKFGARREEAIMIGDQLLTDVLGANRAGVDAIWVQRMEAKEFGPTKINRAVERLLTSAIYKALVLPEERGAPELLTPEERKLTTIEQVFRFLVVGGVSFVIDAGLTYFLMNVVHVGGQEMGVTFGAWIQRQVPLGPIVGAAPDKVAAPILGGAASFFAMINSFIWNRSWTFEAHGKDRRSAQVVRFFTVAILGNVFNAVLFGVFYDVMPGGRRGRTILAKGVAALIVAVWNFVGQRYFAFRARIHPSPQ